MVNNSYGEFGNMAVNDSFVVMAGQGFDTTNSSAPNLVIIRLLTSTGRIDSTFADNGFTKFPSMIAPADVLLLPNQKIIVTGRILGGVSSFNLMRFQANGKLDSTFGKRGVVTSHFGRIQDLSTAVALQPDGKIVVGGIWDNSTYTPSQFIIARYEAEPRIYYNSITGLIFNDKNNNGIRDAGLEI